MASRRAMMFAEYFHRRMDILQDMHLIFQFNDNDPMFQRLQRDREEMEEERTRFFSDTPLLELLAAYHDLALNTQHTPWPTFMLHGIEEFYLQPILDLTMLHSIDFETMRIRLRQLDDFLGFLQAHQLAAFTTDRIQWLRDGLQQRFDAVMQERASALFMATHRRLGGHASIHQISADLLAHIHDHV